jgi:hypothetical protein
MPEPGPAREIARALTEGRKADKFASAPSRDEKGGGLGAAFLASFFSLEKRRRSGFGAEGPENFDFSIQRFSMGYLLYHVLLTLFAFSY